MGDNVIETRALRKRFGDKLAVADLSLSVGAGEVFGFLGPNGAGKTTSLKMLLGLIEPSAGSASVLGRPLGDLGARAKIGFLPEHFRFQEWLTGRELLHFHGRLYGMSGPAMAARADELLGRMDLLDAAHRPIRTYSKGMLQRVGLAQALMNHPRLVFLDEPTSGLDPIGRLLVRDVIRDLRAAGTAVFLNSHLLGEVEATCDRVVFLKAGRTVHEMRLADQPVGVEIELRMEGASEVTLAGLARFGTPLPSGNGVLRMRLDAEARIPEVARHVVEGGARLYQLQATRKTLETWFLEVMGEDQRPG